MAWAVTRTGASPTGSSGVCGRPLRVLAAAPLHGTMSACFAYARCAFCTVQEKVAQRRAQEACRAPAFAHASASPLPRPRSPLCAPHTSTRVQSTLVAHAPCVRASPAMHMLSRGNTRSRQKAWLPCSSHWPLADRRPARRWHIWRECALQCACHLRCARGTCIVHTLCMPSTTTVVTYAGT